MDTFKLWKKLNLLPKSGEPLKKAKEMLDTGYITVDEAAWALTAMAMLPIAMMDVLNPALAKN